MDLPDDVYYHGYWINKNWFAKYKKEFLDELRFPQIKDLENKKVMARIILICR